MLNKKRSAISIVLALSLLLMTMLCSCGRGKGETAVSVPVSADAPAGEPAPSKRLEAAISDGAGRILPNTPGAEPDWKESASAEARRKAS